MIRSKHIVFDNLQATKKLTVSNVKSMKMNDDVLAVAISPDAKHIAVALLDSTVKVDFLFMAYVNEKIIIFSTSYK